jgi:tRNA pseudouridine38-40 synthase
MNRPLLRAFRATISYDGSGFRGSQLQPDSRTVVGEISRALSKVLDHPARPRMASRTDSGVHATGQVIGFRTSSNRTSEQVRKGLNALLPDDIRVLDCMEVGFDFNARHSALGKIYLYRMLRAGECPPMMRSYVLFLPEEKRFDLPAFESEAHVLEGMHDFRSFSPRLEPGEKPVKTIWRVAVVNAPPLIEVRIAGSGFLYQMVRRIIGQLVGVAHGREKPGSTRLALENPVKGAIRYNAQPQGLVLEKVMYSEDEIREVVEGMVGS